MVLIGSIPGPRFGAAVDPTDVFNMVASLTYVNIIQSEATGMAANPIKYWSIDNEPNEAVGNTINFGDYVSKNLFQSVQKIHEAYNGFAAVNSPVIMGPNLVSVGTSDPDTPNVPYSWWTTFFSTPYTEAGVPPHYAAELLDAISTHTYTGEDRSWEEHGVYEDLLHLQGLIAAAPGGLDASGQPKDLWITEHGWNWNWSAEMPRLQADYVVRQYALGAAAGIPHEHNAYYYTEATGAANNFYLWNGKPNRGGMAVRIFNEMTAGMTYDPAAVPGLQTGQYVHAVPYVSSIVNATTGVPDETIVLWGEEFTDPQLTSGIPDVTVTLNFSPLSGLAVSGPQQVHVYDVMGNDITPASYGIQGTTYSYTLPVSGSPIYIVGPHLNYPAENTDLTNYALVESGWPLVNGDPGNPLGGEENFARAAGANPVSSPCAAFGANKTLMNGPTGTPFNSGGVGAINDGSRQYNEGNTPAKTVWVATQGYPLPGYILLPPSTILGATAPMAGNYAGVTFSTAKTIDTLVAAVPSSNNSGGGLTGVRDYQFQITTDGTNWQAVKTVTGNRTERTLFAHFAPQSILGARVVIGAVNNGRWYDDFASYYSSIIAGLYHGSPALAMLYEFEAYGAANQ